MGKFSRLGNDLYEGRVSIDFVGRAGSGTPSRPSSSLVAVFGLVVKGLNFGIEFTGGAEYRVTLPSGR